MSRPVFEGLFPWPVGHSGMRLNASRCPRCGDISFPRRERCRNPECGGRATEDHSIAGTGKLISYTVQHYAPPGPFGKVKPFQPVAIGLVDFPGGIGILGVICSWHGQEIGLGTPARLREWTLYPDEDGNEVVGWAFELEPAV